MSEHELPRARYFLLSFSAAFFVLSLMFLGLMSLLHPQAAVEPEPAAHADAAAESSYFPAGEEALSVLFFGCESDGAVAGTYILARFDPARGSVPVVCLPPQTAVQTDAGEQTLAEAYRYGGAQYARAALERTLDITIDRYVRMSVDSFVLVADTVGSVEYELGEEIELGGGTLSAGMQLLDGKRAAQIIRYEHYEGGELARCNLAAALAAEIVNQRIDLALSTLVDKVFETAINRVDSDISYADYEARKRAAVFLAERDEPPGVAVRVRGQFSADGERFELQDTCKALILQSFS